MVVAPLAHRVAMENSETYPKTDNPILDVGLSDTIKAMRQINVRETLPGLLPLTEASIRLRQNVAFVSAVTTVLLLADQGFVQDVFRDGSENANYFLCPSEEIEKYEDDLIPKAATLKRVLSLICKHWQGAADEIALENETILSPLRMGTRFIEDIGRKFSKSDDLEMGKLATINNCYSLPRGGNAKLIHMKSILEYCHVAATNVPDRFGSLFKKGISEVDANIYLSSFEVFIKESERKKKRMGFHGRQLSMLNQPALKFDTIQLGAKVILPNDDLGSELISATVEAPHVKIKVDIKEIAQRLDVTLMRLMAQVNGVIEAIARAKMDHRIGLMEEELQGDNNFEKFSNTSGSSNAISKGSSEIDFQDEHLSEKSTTEEAACWRFIYQEQIYLFILELDILNSIENPFNNAPRTFPVTKI